MSSLKHQAVSGVKWSAGSQTGRLGAQLITTIILSRLLAPSDFGLVGMAMVAIGFINIFKDLGTSTAVIQKKELSDSLLSSIFWINVCFGFLAMVFLFFGASAGGALYHEPRVIPVLKMFSITFFFSGVGILHQALLSRKMAFKALARIEITAVMIGSILGISLAFMGYGVWSLVFQTLTTTIITTLLLWFSSEWRPKWVFDWKEVKSVSSYSLNLTGFNIFNYFSRNLDYLLIGRYIGAQELGYYTLAYRILLFPLQNISVVIGRVMFPFYSNIQSDNRRFASVYLKVAATISLITFPMMMGVLALAKPFVLTVFEEKWQPVILLIMILAPVGLIQSIGTTVGSIYQAKGRTDWMFRWGIGSGFIFMISFVVGLQWGIVGVATAYAIASYSLSYFAFAIPFHLIDLKFSNFLKVLWWPFVNSIMMFGVLIIFQSLLPPDTASEIILSLSIILGSSVYFLANLLTNREQIIELRNLINLQKPD